MNLFILDKNPQKSSHMYIDIHVNKILIEAYQMLGTACLKHNVSIQNMPLNKSGRPLKGGYPHHPVTKWVGKNKSNYQWTIDHAKALSQEYTYRYNKKHFCENKILELERFITYIPDGNLTEFVQAMPSKYVDDDPVRGYQRYYVADKHYDKNGKNIFKYTKRNIPEFWDKYYKEFHG